MAEDITDFRDQLTMLAECVEILEQTFVSKGKVNIKVDLKESDNTDLCMKLNNNINSNSFVVILGTVEFTFSKT